MTGNWPQEWDDPEDDDFLDENGEPVAEADEAELAVVSAWLAAAPAPVMPAAVAKRISAAIAAESGSARPRVPLPRVLGRRPGRARVRRHSWARPLQVTSTLVVCLLIVGLGFAFSRGGTSSSSSAIAGGSTSSGGTAVPAGAPAYNASGDRSPGAAPFAVTMSGTSYTRAALARQVSATIAMKSNQLTGPKPAASAAGSSPASSVPAASAAVTPAASIPVTRALRGCVLLLTGGAAPRLIDRATYDGTPAYVIATASRVWVVGLGCTAANPERIASVALAG